MARKPQYFIVKLTPPPGATIPELREYIDDAVSTMKGSYHPHDPIFELDNSSIKVTYLPQRKKKPGERK